MILKDLDSLQEILLPDDLLWEDEFKWSPLVTKTTHSITGALIVESGVKLADQPITLKSPDSEMGWVQRAVVAQLLGFLNTERNLEVQFNYPGDTRVFLVKFRDDATPVESEPVKGWNSPAATDWFNITLKLMEVV